MRRRVLFVAFHFPPEGGSGVQRTLKFARYLTELGWDVEVLTVRETTYDLLDPSMVAQVPEQVRVHRTFCVHPVKHLSIAGRHPGIFNSLDPYLYWLPFGVWRGWRLLRRTHFDLIYSTSPGRTAHLIAGTIARWTGIPWVCDFRDPWLSSATEARAKRNRSGRLLVRLLRALERRMLRRASRAIVNTSPSLRELAQRYPDLEAGHLELVPNGYDESDFTGVAPALKAVGDRRLVILHSGEVYPVMRDPRPLIAALESLVKSGNIGANEVRLRFIGAGPALESESFRTWLADRSLDGMVSIEPHLGHQQCIAEMLSADLLLLLQCTAQANMQIPAKFYEYLRTGTPILTVAPAQSATAQIATECRAGWVVDAEDSSGLRAALVEVMELHRTGTLKSNRPANTNFERRQLTVRLREIFEECCRPLPIPAEESAATVSH